MILRVVLADASITIFLAQLAEATPGLLGGGGRLGGADRLISTGYRLAGGDRLSIGYRLSGAGRLEESLSLKVFKYDVVRDTFIKGLLLSTLKFKIYLRYVTLRLRLSRHLFCVQL